LSKAKVSGGLKGKNYPFACPPGAYFISLLFEFSKHKSLNTSIIQILTIDVNELICISRNK